ncbi:MAG: hypothetical protein HYU52_03635 [Acidobacteria bacterium]|nr:hypothetical protein [Acidobacteriota bacterium]
MKTNRTSILATAALVLLALAGSALAAPSISALKIVPGDSIAVGVVKLAELRTSPLSGRIFSEADKLTCDGDGAKFLSEAGLDPAKDIDTITFALRPNRVTNDDDALVVAEGRFDATRVVAALVARGAEEVSTPNGKYYRIREKAAEGEAGGVAVAFVARGFAVMGTEAGVKGALNAVARGGSGFPTSTLGSQISRIDPSASAWMLADVARISSAASSDEGAKKSANLFAAVKKMSYVSMWTTDTGDALKFGGTALSDDAETRQLVEDTIRGALSAARLAAQEKDPELVELLRKVEVKRDGEGVSVEATIPAALLERFHQKAKTHVHADQVASK